MKYHSTLRLALRAASHVTDSDNNRVGREIVAKIEKSKVMPPMKEARTRLYYGVGFSDEWSLFDLLTVSGVIERRGAWYSVTFNDEEIKFQTSGYVQLVSETEGLLRHLQAEAVRILSGDKS
jgi:recombination protein RecA